MEGSCFPKGFTEDTLIPKGFTAGLQTDIIKGIQKEFTVNIPKDLTVSPTIAMMAIFVLSVPLYHMK